MNILNLNWVYGKINLFTLIQRKIYSWIRNTLSIWCHRNGELELKNISHSTTWFTVPSIQFRYVYIGLCYFVFSNLNNNILPSKYYILSSSSFIYIDLYVVHCEEYNTISCPLHTHFPFYVCHNPIWFASMCTKVYKSSQYLLQFSFFHHPHYVLTILSWMFR